MPRAPRLGAAALKRSSLTARSAEMLIGVLRELHPHNINLSAAEKLFHGFIDDLHAAIDQAEPLEELADTLANAPPAPASFGPDPRD